MYTQGDYNPLTLAHLPRWVDVMILLISYQLKMYNFNILDVGNKLKLFKSIVMPVLLYGYETWGFDNTCDVEKIQIRYHKNISGLNKMLQSMMN